MKIISYALVTLLALHSVAHTPTETYRRSARWAGIYSHFQADARHASRSPLRVTAPLIKPAELEFVRG